MAETAAALNAMINIQANTAAAVAQLAALQQAITAVGARVQSAGGSAARGASGFGALGASMSTLRNVLAGFAGGAGFGAVSSGLNNLSHGLASLLSVSVNNAAEFQSLRFGLDAVNVSTKTTSQLLRELKEVALLPGLDFKGAIKGSTRLQGTGMSADMAKRALLGFGNALATVGGGKFELEGVIMALGQIAAKTRVSAEEINQLAERLPQIRGMMQDAFGTTDVEKIVAMGVKPLDFITKIVEQTEKLPKVVGGLKVLFENIGDAFFKLTSAFGLPLGETLAENLNPALNKIDELTVKAEALARVLLEMKLGDVSPGLKVMADGLDHIMGAASFVVDTLKSLGIAIGGVAGGVSVLMNGGSLKEAQQATRSTVDSQLNDQLNGPSTIDKIKEEIEAKEKLIKATDAAREEEEKRKQFGKHIQSLADQEVRDERERQAKVDAAFKEMDKAFQEFSDSIKDKSYKNMSSEDKIKTIDDKRAGHESSGTIRNRMREAAADGDLERVKELEKELKIVNSLEEERGDIIHDMEKDRASKLKDAQKEVNDVRIQALEKAGDKESKMEAHKLKVAEKIAELTDKFNGVLSPEEIAKLAEAQVTGSEEKNRKAKSAVADSLTEIGGGGNAFFGGANLQEKQVGLLGETVDWLKEIAERVGGQMAGGGGVFATN